MKRILIIFTFIFFSCSINDDQVTYEEKLVLWANLRSNFPLIDTVFVARSASLNEKVSSKDLWVDEAQVYIIGDTVNLALMPVVDSPGRYFTNSNYIFQGGMTYKVEAVFENDTISGVTTIPQKMEIISEPQTIYTCKNSTYDVPQININNYDAWSFPPITGPIDTLTLLQGECFTESFASYPLFKINFNEEDYQTVRIMTFALDADSIDLEPYTDTNDDGIWNENEYFDDWNQNGLRDSCFINLIYDTTYKDVYELWKETFPRGSGEESGWEKNTPFRYNPWPWNVETSPVSMNWLFFDYYGLQLMTFQATDDATFNYFQGLPEFNQFVMPNSNVVNGYGLVSSSASRSFLVYIKRDQSNSN